MNAVKHGAFRIVRGAVTRGPLAEDPDAIEELVVALMESLDPPADLLARRLAEDLAWAMVKEERVVRFEAELLTDPLGSGNSNEVHLRDLAHGHVEAARGLRHLGGGGSLSRDQIINVLSSVAFAPQVNEFEWSEMPADTPTQTYLETLEDLLKRRFESTEAAANLAEALAHQCNTMASAENDAVRPEAVRSLLRTDLLARLDRAGAHASREIDRKMRRYRERLAELAAVDAGAGDK